MTINGFERFPYLLLNCIVVILLIVGCGSRKPTKVFYCNTPPIESAIGDSRIEYTWKGLVDFEKLVMGIYGSSSNANTTGFKIFFPPTETETTIVSVVLEGQRGKVTQTTVNGDLEFIFGSLMTKNISIDSLKALQILLFEREISSEKFLELFNDEWGARSIESPVSLGFRSEILHPPCYFLEIFFEDKREGTKFCDPIRERSTNDDNFLKLIDYCCSEKN